MLFEDVLWVRPVAWFALLTCSSTRNLTVAVPFFTQKLWECSGMADISVDILRFSARNEIKEQKLFGRHLAELRKWIKEVALEGKQDMIPHEDTAVPETPCAANLPTPEVLSRSDEFVCLQFIEFLHILF